MGEGGEISRASTGLLEKRVEFELSSEGVLLATIQSVARSSLEGGIVTPFYR